METTYLIRGKEVTLREGDLLLIHSDRSLLNRALAFVGGGYSHVGTLVQRGNELKLCSVYVAPDGLVFENPSIFADAVFSKLAVVRPHARRTPIQIHALRLACEDAHRLDAACGHASYERGPLEFLATLLHLPSATNSQWHCSELTARLARAVGAWPEGKTVSVGVGEVASVVGTVERLF